MAGLLSLDDALTGAAEHVGSRVQGKKEIAITAIDSSLLGVSEYLSDELAALLISTGTFIVLERGKALEALNTEHGIQMSGLVSDESAVGIGHYLGAKVVLTGTFNSFTDFSQLRIRALDVETSQILTLYTIKILPNDIVLENIIQSQNQNNMIQAVSQNAIDHLNRGVDLYNAGKFAEAIGEFNQALNINSNLAEAYYHRANTRFEYNQHSDYDWSDEEWDKWETALGMDQDDYTLNEVILADYNAALNIKPDYADALNNRGYMYCWHLKDYDLAIADLKEAIRIRPNFVNTHIFLGDTYNFKSDYNNAVTSYTNALRIDPNNTFALFNRASVYASMRNYEKAIADHEAILRIYDSDGTRMEIENLRRRIQQ